MEAYLCTGLGGTSMVAEERRRSPAMSASLAKSVSTSANLADFRDSSSLTSSREVRNHKRFHGDFCVSSVLFEILNILNWFVIHTSECATYLYDLNLY
ncbi:hypothetical protein HW555_007100 [Spodoptera exigua]|uniref:Uncharacterized protein n=1 Tax=Spodoptera exigua TaxID=7107 RepID=A0A835GHU1_SPOEX|nr:hypothetical protein HW555_007100 [Spodoptera exigua]